MGDTILSAIMMVLLGRTALGQRVFHFLNSEPFASRPMPFNQGEMLWLRGGKKRQEQRSADGLKVAQDNLYKGISMYTQDIIISPANCSILSYYITKVTVD